MFRAMAVDFSVLLLSCSITTGALGSPDLLLSYYMITLALYNTIILIVTLKSTQIRLQLCVGQVHRGEQ